MAGLYGGSDYVKKRQAAEAAEFDRVQRRKYLSEIFEANNRDVEGIKGSYNLSAEDTAYLEQLKEEQAAQDKLGAAFVRAFTEGFDRHGGGK